MILYHATNEKGFRGIVSSGCIKPGVDGIVYLADSAGNALKFVAVRTSFRDTIYVFRVEVPDNEVSETFDHSYRYFKCKSYGYRGNITVGDLTNTCWKYPGLGGEM